jgi:hypothetical protein
MPTISTGTNFPTDGNIFSDSNWAWEPPAQPIAYEHTIQGQMFMVEYQPSEVVMASMSDDVVKQRIKEDIAFSLALKMIEEGAIVFTQIPDFNNGTKIIKARCYLVPDNQVRILRTLYKDK